MQLRGEQFSGVMQLWPVDVTDEKSAVERAGKNEKKPNTIFSRFIAGTPGKTIQA
jgi:hypothetical protein